MDRVRLAVHTIALNEIKHVDDFMRHCAEADEVIVCDTGSTDGTAERFEELGAKVYRISVKPWRFDDARNTALSLVSPDIDIALSIDIDEFLQPGWRNEIQTAWDETNGKVTRIGYNYIWNWKADGTPDKQFIANKIHARRGYRWRHPCHETLYYEGAGHEWQVTRPGLVLEHHADFSKSRGQYLPLLKIAVEEDPTNDIMRLWYARELMFHAHYDDAIEHFHVYLKNTPGPTEERASGIRYLSRCHGYKGNNEDSTSWAWEAVKEWPHTREPWLDLVRAANRTHDWKTAYYAATKALAINNPVANYIGEPASYSSEPYDLACLAAYYSGHYKEALTFACEALTYNPDDGRFQNNIILCATLDTDVDKYQVTADNFDAVRQIVTSNTRRCLITLADESIRQQWDNEFALPYLRNVNSVNKIKM